GFFRRLDGPIMRVVDAMMSFPDILLAIALVAVLGASMANVILALAIVYTPRVARVVRASTLVVRELLFIEAARALGVSTWRIMFIHILNNIASPILVQVKHLQTHFFTDAGVVKAVEDVSFSLNAGETLAVVGESGSGKSVTSLSIMGLIPNPPGRIVGGEILFRPREGAVVDLAKLPVK